MINQVLTERVKQLLQSSNQHRVLIGIAGSPGGGKTTLALELVGALNAQDNLGEKAKDIAVHLPMDGFHLANETLDRLGLRNKKGSIETFDGWGFIALLNRVLTERDHTVFAPSFHRSVDEGVAGAIPIEDHHRIVVVEGNYLLSERQPWNGVLSLLTEAWFCQTPEDERLLRLIDRHTRHGRDLEAATNWAKEVDGLNAKYIETTSPRARLIVSGISGEILEERFTAMN